MTEPIRVLIVDDQELVRHSFRIILEAQPDITVVGEASNGHEALDLAGETRPDVALVDIRMPGISGLEVTRTLIARNAGIRVVVITTFDLDEYVHAALRYGASGFLLKRSGPALLTEAVRAAMNGDTLISPSVTVRLLRDRTGRERTSRRHATDPLTERELDVLRLLAQGHTNAEIGARLFLSTGTVKNHVANIQRKLRVRNRVGAAAWAWDTGIVTTFEPGP